MTLSKILKNNSFQRGILFAVIVSSITMAHANWNSLVSDGDPLNADTWNNSVNKLISLDSDIININSSLSTISSNISNFSFPGSGNVTISGTMSAATPTADEHLTTKGYVDGIINASADTDWTIDSGNIYRSTGNVGIGTTSPSTKLHVSNGSSGNTIPSNSFGIYESNINAVLSLSVPNTREALVNFPRGTNQYYAAIGRNNDSFVIKNANSERMRITSTGNIGIGTTLPVERLHVSGNILASGTIPIYASKIILTASDII